MDNVNFSEHELKRLKTEKTMWLASVKPNNSPHLVPLWFVFDNFKIYMCTTGSSIKIRNIRQNPRVAVSLEDGYHALILECQANVLSQPFSKNVVQNFKDKFDWNIAKNDLYNVLIEMSPVHKLAFNDER